MSKRTEGRKVTKTFGCIETPPFFGVRPLLPTLTPAADFLVEVGQPVSVGETAQGLRRVVPITDGALVYIENCGVRFGPAEVMARMTRGEPVDPAQVYFRTTPRFEVEGKAHQWLTRALFVASGVRHPDRVVLSVFEVG